jgi:hypothetical protein
MWPDALNSKNAAYVKANKKGELNDIFHDLDAIKAEHRKFETQIEFPPAKATVDKAQTWGRSTAQFVSSPNMKKLVGSLKIVGKRAATAATKPKISSDAKKALGVIAKAANDHAAVFEPAKITAAINKIVHDLVEEDKKRLLGRLSTVFKSYNDCAKRGHPEIAEAKKMLAKWKNTPNADAAAEANAVGVKINGTCRDMTQNIQNLVNAIGYGADLTQFGLQDRDVTTLPKLAKTLVPFANTSTGVGTGKSYKQMEEIVKLVDVNAKLYDQIAQRMPG